MVITTVLFWCLAVSVLPAVLAVGTLVSDCASVLHLLAVDASVGTACCLLNVTSINLATQVVTIKRPVTCSTVNGAKRVTRLDCMNFNLTGTLLPVSGLDALQYLDVSNNLLQGTLVSLSNMFSLRTIYLGYGESRSRRCSVLQMFALGFCPMCNDFNDYMRILDDYLQA
jgi:hypothetical protein